MTDPISRVMRYLNAKVRKQISALAKKHNMSYDEMSKRVHMKINGEVIKPMTETTYTIERKHK